MASGCQTVPDMATFSADLLRYIDCQARSIGSGGYSALGSNGGIGAALLAGCLTIVVAVVGYRLLLGEAPSLREGVLTLVKIGFALALTTGWPAYQTLFYDTAMNGPAEIASNLDRSDAASGSAEDLSARLNGADRAFRRLAIAGVGPVVPIQAGGTGDGPPPPLFGGFDNFALGSARAAMLAGALGGMLLVRLGAGLLLGLGPLFVAFLLFQATRSLFEGWIRGLAAALIGSVVTMLVVNVELALFEPWLAHLIGRRAASLDIAGSPIQLLSVALIFDVTIAGLIFFGFRIAFAAPMIPAQSVALPRVLASLSDRSSMRARMFSTDRVSPFSERSRAMSIADAVRATERREQQGNVGNAEGSRASRRALEADRTTGYPAGSSTAVADDVKVRRTVNRVSAHASRRDRAS